MAKIIFNKPFNTPLEIESILDSIKRGKISGDGYYAKLCNEWFLNQINRKVLLTRLCTAALEMMALLLDLKSGDEVIMPSYTFVSTANAFVLRDAKPAFADIRPDTLVRLPVFYSLEPSDQGYAIEKIKKFMDKI
jgi:dTDP-4-amino-4,6-dideoxygalactose transaminase